MSKKYVFYKGTITRLQVIPIIVINIWSITAYGLGNKVNIIRGGNTGWKLEMLFLFSFLMYVTWNNVATGHLRRVLKDFSRTTKSKRNEKQNPDRTGLDRIRSDRIVPYWIRQDRIPPKTFSGKMLPRRDRARTVKRRDQFAKLGLA